MSRQLKGESRSRLAWTSSNNLQVARVVDRVKLRFMTIGWTRRISAPPLARWDCDFDLSS
jgi:hypothetical protein